jgi:hypothetical protein
MSLLGVLCLGFFLHIGAFEHDYAATPVSMYTIFDCQFPRSYRTVSITLGEWLVLLKDDVLRKIASKVAIAGRLPLSSNPWPDLGVTWRILGEPWSIRANRRLSARPI